MDGEERTLETAWRAHAQARRVFDDLLSTDRSLEAFRDRVPYMLDRLDNVWRLVDRDSRGRRTREFGTWWAEQWRHDHRQVVRFLRNLELKENMFVTTAVFTFKSENHLWVDEAGRVSVRPP